MHTKTGDLRVKIKQKVDSAKNHTKIGPTVKSFFDPRVLPTALINIHFSRGRLNEISVSFLIFKCLARRLGSAGDQFKFGLHLPRSTGLITDPVIATCRMCCLTKPPGLHHFCLL